MVCGVRTRPKHRQIGSLLGLFAAFIFVADPVGCTAPSFKIDANPLTMDGTEVTACSSSYHGHDEDDYGG
jgi:hypothetical protein